ncbi:MAG: cytochrome ubiquinol oxidase subunit I [Bradymonadia bacterium]
MDLDVLFLSRLQFAFTIMFHYIFPPLSIGLGAFLVLIEAKWLKTGDRRYEAMARFWTRIFAVNFAMGVATGIVMEFEFGTNWAVYSRFVGDVFGSALAAEGIFAFFLESGFLAVLVFGWDRVSRKMHFFSTVMVALGSTFSAVWIVIANSWQQTPAGYHIVGEGLAARAEITDFWAMVFNPSSMHRLGHVVLGSWIQGAFVVLSISAWYLLKKRHVDFARRSFSTALVMAAVSSVAILVSGHSQADKVSQTQPAKLAAFEGHFETGPADLYLFGIPDVETGEVHFGLKIPGGLSFLLHQDFDAPVKGLDAFPEADRPPVMIPFLSYHLMAALGMAMIGLTALGMFLLWRKKLFDNRPVLWLFVVGVIAPYLANQAGWVAAEVGRQPWIVYGELRTSDGLSQAVTGEMVLSSIIMFGLIYALLFAVWIFVLHNKITHGPPEPEGDEPPHGGGGLLEAAAARPSATASLTEEEA